MKLFWGDLHNHCGITYGYGSLQNALEIAKMHLDFCSVTPHAMWPDIPSEATDTSYLRHYHLEAFNRIKNTWEEVKKLVDKANIENEFVTFFSFEMHSSKFGDYHIVSPSNLLRLIYEESPQQVTIKQVCQAIAIPHHIAYTPGYRGVNWMAYDENISPVVEVFSKHGCGLKDDADFPYLHTMGPRDSQNTAYSGLLLGKRFSFVGSTDHHAGFPGSYGDGKLAVLAHQKSRKAIWEAILQGHTYAVTGDKIKCQFSVNGMPFGSKIGFEKKRALQYNVEGSDMLDKIVIYRNLRPILIKNGEWLRREKGDRTFKVRLEVGWGDEPQLTHWETRIKIHGGRFLDVELCLRGHNILSPIPNQPDYSDINRPKSNVNVVDGEVVEFSCVTSKNLSTTSSHTNAIVLTIDGNNDTQLEFAINCRELSISLGDLALGSITGHLKEFASPAFRIHRAIANSEYSVSGEYTEERTNPNDFYHMEVRQKNGCSAFVSPVFLGSENRDTKIR